MSDTLREAKVRVAEFVRQFSKLGDTGGRVHSVHTDPNTNSASLLSADLDTILATYPADTETEWGVMRVDDETVIILSSRETACELLLSDERIVSRQVTPWQREP